MATTKKWNPQKPDKRLEGPTVRDAGQYGILCCIPFGRYNSEFAFGLTKAKAIKQHYKFICKFIEEQEQPKLVDFDENPEIAAMVEERKRNIMEQKDDDTAYIRQIFKAHESTENYDRFTNGEVLV